MQANNKKKLSFIHITKCAGTFIEDIGNLNNQTWGRHHKEYGWWHEIFIKKPLKLKEKYDWFVIVRNPYTRILSEYYCQWGGINHRLCKNVKNIKNNKDFNDFLIERIKKRKLDGDHYTEQYKYIDENIDINIIKYENINTALQVLFDEYNININVSDYNKRNTKEYINKTNILPYTVDNFNEELITLINTVYDKDFQLFGYNKKEIKKPKELQVNGQNKKIHLKKMYMLCKQFIVSSKK